MINKIIILHDILMINIKRILFTKRKRLYRRKIFNIYLFLYCFNQFINKIRTSFEFKTKLV